VLGVGNVLLGDDGVGVRVVEALRAAAASDPASLPAETRLVDGGTLGLDLLDELDGARSLLVVDAVDLGQPAGTVRVLRDPELSAVACGMRNGVEGGVGGLLGMARLMGWLPARVALVGIQADDTRSGTGLSGRVSAALPRAVDAVRAELRRLDDAIDESSRGQAREAASRAAGVCEAEGATA
jgi:hydrogenase maturation protease